MNAGEKSRDQRPANLSIGVRWKGLNVAALDTRCQ